MVAIPPRMAESFDTLLSMFGSCTELFWFGLVVRRLLDVLGAAAKRVGHARGRGQTGPRPLALGACACTSLLAAVPGRSRAIAGGWWPRSWAWWLWEK